MYANARIELDRGERKSRAPVMRSKLIPLMLAALLISSSFIVLMSLGSGTVTVPSDPAFYHEEDQISFGANNSIGDSSDDTNGIVAADLDNDGDMDLVTTSYGEVVAWNNTGSAWGTWVGTVIAALGMSNGTCVAAGDLDNDGWTDIVFGDDQAKVWTIKNTGDPFTGGWPGPYRLTTTSGAPFAIKDIALGDMDYDGWLDVAAVDNSTTGNYFDLMQNDMTPFDGSLFSGMSNWAISACAGTSIALGDIDGDGWCDAVTGDVSGLVVGWENDGNPWDNPLAAWALADRSGSGAIITSVGLADLDNDCDLDIITGDDLHFGYVWNNTGGADSWDAKVGTDIDNKLGGEIFDLTASDFDNDGWMDVAFTMTNYPGIKLFENDMTPFNGSWLRTEVLGGGGGSGKVVCAVDLDNDGDMDAASGLENTTAGGEIYVWKNMLIHRNLPFDTSGSQVGDQSVRGYCVKSADLDNDGDMDLVTTTGDNMNSTMAIWQNDGTPFSGTWPYYSFGRITDCYSVEVADLDHDGWNDIILGRYGSTGVNVMVFQNDGTPWDGGWVSDDAGAGTGSFALCRSVAVADLDNDGWLDIVAGVGASGGHSIPDDFLALRNDRTPFTGGYWSTNPVGAGGVDLQVHVAVADFDHDGWTDVATTSYNGTCYVWQNDGTPFADPWAANLAYSTGNWMMDVEGGDLDGDGWCDLVIGAHWNDPNSIIAIRNDATPFSGTWAKTDVGDTWNYIPDVEVADVDCDGDLDILSDGSPANVDWKVSIWQNDGNPWSDGWNSTTAGLMTYSFSAAWCIETADLDNDGRPDMISGDVDGGGLIKCYRNVGAQVTMDVSDISPAFIWPGDKNAVFWINVTHDGRAGDSNLSIDSWSFRFYHADGTTPFTASEMNQTFDNVSIELDEDEDGIYDNASGPSIASYWTFDDNNRATVDPSGSNITLNPPPEWSTGKSKLFFFVVKINMTAAPIQFRVAFDPDGYSSGDYNRMMNEDTGKVLSIEQRPPEMTQMIGVTLIPEFGALIVPIVGIVAIVVLMRRRRDKTV